MFTGNVMLLPGMEQRVFTVYRPLRRGTELGRVLRDSETRIGQITAILAEAKPEEKERWKQLEHPITHKIIMQYIPPFKILSGDVFEYELQPVFGSQAAAQYEQRVRRFYNQALPYNVGDIGHWNIFYCEERTSLE